jgi:hypothetical protein
MNGYVGEYVKFIGSNGKESKQNTIISCDWAYQIARLGNGQIHGLVIGELPIAGF